MNDDEALPEPTISTVGYLPEPARTEMSVEEAFGVPSAAPSQLELAMQDGRTVYLRMRGGWGISGTVVDVTPSSCLIDTGARLWQVGRSAIDGLGWDKG